MPAAPAERDVSPVSWKSAGVAEESSPKTVEEAVIEVQSAAAAEENRSVESVESMGSIEVVRSSAASRQSSSEPPLVAALPQLGGAPRSYEPLALTLPMEPSTSPDRGT
ncbi:MAG: hypothetical protein GY772_21085 [bacterium]|nr:hypothetical protein [bacterium]